MKRSEKHLPSKASFSTFLQLNCSNFGLNFVKGLRVTKFVKKIKFGGVWGEMKCFQRKTFTKYLRLTLVLISVFQEFFAHFPKFLFWQEDWALDYHPSKFKHFPDIS